VALLLSWFQCFSTLAGLKNGGAVLVPLVDCRQTKFGGSLPISSAYRTRRACADASKVTQWFQDCRDYVTGANPALFGTFLCHLL
jgi:hypothetical protein